ncbi:xin actin-binding repeat-containing 2 [Pelobates cultripes]|uniref:Xin actin-binding repeat-containing 2 n=2 Tax=Pelobates cultripes TaxID=61616 RepID=A0AAD1SRC8_PELCU|nr:xin actin-binding repeat-containing 2 [Pelobates cultripes]
MRRSGDSRSAEFARGRGCGETSKNSPGYPPPIPTQSPVVSAGQVLADRQIQNRDKRPMFCVTVNPFPHYSSAFRYYREAEIERSLRSPAFKKQPGSHSSISTKDSDTRGGKTYLHKMSESGQSSVSEGSSKSERGQSKEDTTRSGTIPLDFQESLSLKERMDMYQAAASTRSQSSTAQVLKESEMCSVPGGLANMKKQFETSDVASSQSAMTQYQYQHKAVKETRKSNQVTFMSSSQSAEQHVSQSDSQFLATGEEQVSVHEQSTQEKSRTSNYNHEADGVDYKEIPKISTQVLKEQFERPFKEKDIAHGKNTKIYNDYPEFEWPVVNTKLSDSTSRVIDETSAATSAEHTSTSANAGSLHFGSLEEFPPPPPDILETPDMTEFSQSPEPASNTERQVPTASKDVYSKQRNLYELKRLYKHIHPEVRKNLQKEFISDVTDIVASQRDQKSIVSSEVQQAKYAMENSRDSPQKCMSPEREYLEWDEILKGEVQSMRWVFENQPLDSIKDDSQEQSHIKSIGEQEIIAGGDVKYTTWMFETQPIHALSADNSDSFEGVEKVPELARGDVRTATWLFETQPLDALNKIYKENDSCEMLHSLEEITGGDVKTGKYLFETQFNDSNFGIVDEMNMLRLRSELQEIRGDVKRTIKQFETEPKYVLKDSSGKVLEIKTVCKEDIEKGDVKTARWMFETQPLDTINQDEVKVVRGISMEESVKGGVGKTKWLFESQPLDSIKEEQTSVTEKEAIIGADVYQKCWIFETIPMDLLKDKANERPLQGEEIIGGNVSDTKNLFETVPIDELKESITVGKLKQVITTEEERGDVQHQRWIFETKPLEHIREERKDYIRTVQLDEIHKGDVNSHKLAFEKADWKNLDFSSKIQVEDVNTGSVTLNRKLFETTPLYAIEDRFGHYHEVQTIRQEEVVRGDVRSCQWMFETIPIDQFRESVENYQIIKGISSQEIVSGDVKTGKWLFETQPLDAIKYFSNVEDEEHTKENNSDIIKGDVKACTWLFETQPMENLYEKEVKKTINEDIQKGDVKTCTWLFETQPLDSIQDDSEKSMNEHIRNEEIIQGRDVQTVCFLFETQNLEDIHGEDKKDFKRIVEIDVQSGDVSTMKYIFENQPLDKISLSSEEVLQKIKTMKHEDLQNGNVLNCRWLFENHCIDEINGNLEENKSSYAIMDVQGGNVRKGCFIFETFSLDQIRDASTEDSLTKTVGENEIMKGDVKNYTLMFETQPLYAIQDKEGHYHEVTTVKKEEVSHGNVCGTRWLFETKPLDSFNESDEVFVIKAVTQEDIKKGDVSSVRWKFETQSLDAISDDVKAQFRTVDYVEGGNVKANKELFENEESKNQFVRTVSISEIKHGNVKTSTWLFETHTLDEIHTEDYQNIKTVTMEDIHKGDVQEAVWLFESQNLDSIRDDEEYVTNIRKETIPQADVKTTTWLFETTPLHEFNDHKLEREDIVGKSIHETLKELYSQNIVESHGIIIEADEIGDVRMAKYHLMNKETPEIQKEEIISGDLQHIMMNLLSQNSTTERMVQLNEEEKGNITLTKSQLLKQSSDAQIEREHITGGDIQEAIKNLFDRDDFKKQGILIQESEKGDIKMTLYSLLNQSDNTNFQRDEVLGGDIKRTIYNLKSSAMDNERSEKLKIGESERGNVQFYTTCIESGALDYLKNLQRASEDIIERESEEIIGGDVEGTKLLLKKQQSPVERTVDETDIIPGDVYNTVKVFMTEPDSKLFDVNKEEVVKGNLRATLQSLNQAVNQAVLVEKEQIIKADLPATLKSLTESQYQVRDSEKPDVIPGDIQGTIESLEKAVNTKMEFVREDVISGNIEATLKSLKESQQTIKHAEKETLVKGDVNAAVQNLLESCTENKTTQHQANVQGNVKGTLKTLLQPSFQTTQRRASVEGNVKNTIKHFLQSTEETQSENEMFIKNGISGENIIFEGQSDQTVAAKADCRNQQSINSSRQNVIEAHDIFVDNATLKNDMKLEMNDITSYDIDNRDAFSSVEERKLPRAKHETCKTRDEHNTVSDVQNAELIGKVSLLQGFNEGHMEKTHTDLINQNKVMQREKLSASVSMSKSTTYKQPINVINKISHHAADHVQKQVSSQQTQHAQHSRKTFAKGEAHFQQTQSLDSLNNNVENAEDVQNIKQKHRKAKETENVEMVHIVKNKSVQEAQEKSKIVSSRGNHQHLTKNQIDSANISKQIERPEMFFLPPSPLQHTSSSQLPLPPPPPPLPVVRSFKYNDEPEYFPSPPPPVDDKLDNEMLTPLPETPPPHIQHKDVANRKVTFLPLEQRTSQSEQLQSYSNIANQTGISVSQMASKTEQVSRFSEKQTSVLPQKSRLPVFQPKIGDRSETKINESKNIQKKSTILRKESTSHSHSETSEQIRQHGLQITSQGTMESKKKGFCSPQISQVSKPDIPPSKPSINEQISTTIKEDQVSANKSNAQDIDQVRCDKELEQIEQSLKLKKKVVFSPQLSQPVIETLPIKPAITKTGEYLLSSSKMVMASVDEKVSTSQLNAEDIHQLICDQELVKNNEETLKDKKKVVFSQKVSPSPPPKFKTDNKTVNQVNESKSQSLEIVKSIETHNIKASESSEQDLDQLACDRELERIHEESLKPKKKVFFTPRMSPAIRTDTPTAKPKTYIRKFKTPLMIAEEKYRQQREEMEKNKTKVVSQVISTTTIKSEANHVTKDLESGNSILKMSEISSNDFGHVNVQLNARENTISSKEFEQRFNPRKHEPATLTVTSDVSSLSNTASTQEEQVKQEQTLNIIQEYNIVQQTKEQLSKSQISNKVDESELVKDSTILPKPEVTHVDKHIQNKSKSEMKMKQIQHTGNILQNESTNVQKKRAAEEKHKVRFSEKQFSQKVNAQSISQSSEQHLSISRKSQALCNETETKKGQIQHVGISVLKGAESPSPPILKKDQEVTEQIKMEKNIGVHEHSEKSKSFLAQHKTSPLPPKQTIQENKVSSQHKTSPLPPKETIQENKVSSQHKTSPLPPKETIQENKVSSQHKTSPLPPKETIQENKVSSQNIAKEMQINETTAKKEISEKKQQMSLLPEAQNKYECNSLDVIEYIRKCEELQQTVSKANKLESDPHTLNIQTFTTFLKIVPTWLINQDKKNDMAELAASNDSTGISEQISYIKNHAMNMHSSFKDNIHTAMKSSTTAKSRLELSGQNTVSQKQISTISRKVEKTNQVFQEKSKISKDLGRFSSDFKQMDYRACSPSLKTRSPSPTYITIESTVRRTDSPQKERHLSQSPLQKDSVTVPLPPKRSMTPKTTSPSPTPQKNRSEQLAKLKDTTAKLSHGTAQARAVTPVPIVIEKKCEIIHSPATLRRQLKIGSVSITPTPASEVAFSTLEDRREIHEEVRKSELHETHLQQNPKHIPKWQGTDMDSLDVISVTQKFEVPTSHAFERKDTNVHSREEANLQEKSVTDSKAKLHKSDEMSSGKSAFRTSKGTFQTEQKKVVHQGIQKSFSDVSEVKSSPHDNMKGKTRTVPIKQLKGPKGNASQQIYVNRQHEHREHILNPVLHSETISVTDMVSGIGTVESNVGRTRSSLNADGIESGFEFKHAPPTYEDVISGHMLDISATESPEEILKNFQKTWEESERVFKSLGYSVSDTAEIRSSYHQEEFITENAASGKGSLHCLSKEGLSNGIPNSRQADLS